MDVAKLKYDQLLQVRIPFDLHEKAKAKSDETGITLSHVVRQALEKWIEKTAPS